MRAIARQEELAGREATPAFVEADRELPPDRSSPPPATRSCSRSTTRCATARAAWASWRIARDDGRTRQILDEHRALVRAVGAGDEAGALAVLDAHLGTTLALLRAAPAEPSGD